MSRITPQMYLELWLSEQIPTQLWLQILKDKDDVKKLYNSYMMEKKK